MNRRIGFVLLASAILLTGQAAAQGDLLAACADVLRDYVPVTGTDSHPAPDLPLPPPREPYADPVFGTCVLRISDHTGDFGGSSAGIKNEYSRVQAFNADESLILARGLDGSGVLYDARTLAPRLRLDLPDFDEPRWDAADPHRFVYSPWGAGVPQVMAVELAGDDLHPVASVARDFAADLPPAWNGQYLWRRWEGSPSADGRYDAFMVEDGDFITRGLITVDWQTGAVIGWYDVPGDVNEPDSVSMSPSGAYVLAQFEYCEPGTMGTYESPCGAMIYNRDLSRGWGIARIIGHSDLAYDAAGREVLVYQEIDTDQIAMADLATGEVTPLLDLDFSGGAFGLHFSGQAFDRPGWAVVSVYAGPEWAAVSDPFWMVGTVFALELKADPRVVGLAHHHSVRDDSVEADYFAEPQASANRDLTRVLFGSNWGATGTADVEMMMIVLPDDWADRLE